MTKMEAVICYCLNCNQELGRFRNSWNGIGKNFYSPVYPMLSYNHGYEVFGDVYPGPVDTPLEHSFLQTLRCKGCQNLFGTRCDSAPDGHILARDQQILKRQSISVTSESTGMTVSLNVTKSVAVLPEDMAKKSSSSRRAATAQPASRQKINDHQRYDQNPLQISSVHLLPAKNGDVSDTADFKSWAKDSIDLQKNDIMRISSTLSNVEGEMQIFRNFMQEVRTELQQSQKMREDYNQDRRKISKLVEDVAELKKRVKEVDNAEARRGLSGESLIRDIEIIVSDMQQVSDKANEVEDLKIGILHIAKQFKGLEKTTTSYIASNQPNSRVGSTDDLTRQIRELQSRLNLVDRKIQIPSAEAQNAAETSLRASGSLLNVRQISQSSLTPKFLKRKHDLVESPIVAVDMENNSELPLQKKRGGPRTKLGVNIQPIGADLGIQSPASIVPTKDRPPEIVLSERDDTPLHEEVASNTVKIVKIPRGSAYSKCVTYRESEIACRIP